MGVGPDGTPLTMSTASVGGGLEGHGDTVRMAGQVAEDAHDGHEPARRTLQKRRKAGGDQRKEAEDHRSRTRSLSRSFECR